MGDQQPCSRQLPEDTVMDILSRLPVRTLLRHQLVCRRWKDLTSTIYFSQMQKKREESSTPMILLEVKTKIEGYGQILVDKTEDIARIDRVLDNSDYRIQFSWDGLMLLRSYIDYMVFNPITQEKVKIRPPTLLIDPCGIFFHPLVEQYCILWTRWPLQPTGVKMLTLGQKMCWRDLCTGSSLPSGIKYTHGNFPVVVDDVLYWLSFHLEEPMNWRCQIFAFDIRREEISFEPFPDSNDWKHTTLLEMKGQLSLVHASPSDNRMPGDMHIWILINFPNPIWTKIYTIDMTVHYPFSFRPVVFMNDKLILQQINSGRVFRLIAYNLESCSTRTLAKFSTDPILASAHVPRIVSIRNGESNQIHSCAKKVSSIGLQCAVSSFFVLLAWLYTMQKNLA